MVQVRVVGRIQGLGGAIAAASATFGVRTAPGEVQVVRVVGEEAVARLKSLGRGTSVVVDGRWVGGRATLLASAVVPLG